MYGKDVEATVSSISGIIGDAISELNNIADMIKGPIWTNCHTHAPGEVETHKEVKKTAGVNVPSGGGFSGQAGKIGAIEGNLYKGASQVNNSAGSPHSEVNALNDLTSGNSGGDADYLGDKIAAALKTIAIALAAIDAKTSVITYQDSLQRGYDQVHNGKKASIKWDNYPKDQASKKPKPV